MPQFQAKSYVADEAQKQSAMESERTHSTGFLWFGGRAALLFYSDLQLLGEAHLHYGDNLLYSVYSFKH